MHHHRGGNTQPNNQFNKQLVSIKLGTLLSSQTTTTPNQHTTKETKTSSRRSAPGQLHKLTRPGLRKQIHPTADPHPNTTKQPAKTGHQHRNFRPPHQAGQLEKQYTPFVPQANQPRPLVPVVPPPGRQAPSGVAGNPLALALGERRLVFGTDLVPDGALPRCHGVL